MTVEVEVAGGGAQTLIPLEARVGKVDAVGEGEQTLASLEARVGAVEAEADDENERAGSLESSAG